MDEIPRAGDRAVHVGFGGQVEHVGDGVPSRHFEHARFVAEIHPLEAVLRVPGHTRQVLRVAGVSQTIQVDQPLHLGSVNDVVDHVGADEPGPASE